VIILLILIINVNVIISKMDDISNNLQLFDLSNLFQKNTEESSYSLKLNNYANLKFFKDELTIKYIGKGSNTIDYAVC